MGFSAASAAGGRQYLSAALRQLSPLRASESIVHPSAISVSFVTLLSRSVAAFSDRRVRLLRLRLLVLFFLRRLYSYR